MLVSVCVFTSCEDDVDDTQVAVTVDCENLGLNIGESCNLQGLVGVVSDSCECVVDNDTTGGTFDCPSLQLNFGDDCTLAGGISGTVDGNCECSSDTLAFDCPDIQAFFGDPCDDGDVNTVNDVIGLDCQCTGTPAAEWDCPDLQLNNGDSCVFNGFPGTVYECECNYGDPSLDCPNLSANYGDFCNLGPGIPYGYVDLNCDCIEFDCPDAQLNVGDQCFTSFNMEGTMNADCECIEDTSTEFDCPDLFLNIGDSCSYSNGMIIYVNSDCECL